MSIEQEVDVMCNLSQGIKETGIAEGRAEEIIETGYEFGLSEQDILERLQKKLSISLQKAQEYLLMLGSGRCRIMEIKGVGKLPANKADDFLTPF